MTSNHNNLPVTTLASMSAQMYLAGNYHDAIKYCNAFLDQETNNYEILNLLGLSFFRLGNHDRAEKILSHCIELFPLKSDAFCNLGLVYKSKNKYEKALSCFDKAIALNTPYFQAYLNQGLIFQILNQHDLAINSFSKALHLSPENSEIIFALANSFFLSKQYKTAISHYKKIATNHPIYSQALNNYGVCLKNIGNYEAAVEYLSKAIQINPQYATAFNNRGSVYFDLGQYQNAIKNYADAIRIEPNYAQAYFNLGMAYEAINEVKSAVSSYQKALSIDPNSSDVLNNFGAIMQRENRLHESLYYLNKALLLSPHNYHALNNRAVTLQNSGQFDDALKDLDLAIKLNPNFAQAYVNKAMILLLHGHLQQGFELYEWRWNNLANLASLANAYRTKHLWDGSQSLTGKVILLTSEQGLGDTIQFSRYAKLISELGARVIVETHSSLADLFKNVPGIDQVIPKGVASKNYDYHCPLMSLPFIFKTSLTTIPSIFNYICSNSNRVEAWKKRLGNKTGLRVGLTWAGNKTHRNDFNRSLPINALVQYLPSNIEYISLQKEIASSDKSFLQSKLSNLRFYEDDLVDFVETSALVDCLDLIITVDTSIAHLGGAMGKKTWVLLPYVPDWRWLLHRKDSPWYPTIRLYRQNELGKWDDPLIELRNDLLTY